MALIAEQLGEVKENKPDPVERSAGGSRVLSQQLKILSDSLHGFWLESLNPNLTCIKSSPGMIPYILYILSEFLIINF